ncbi:putative adenylyl-sulfate kinase [Kordia antarctica]|uniref:Adenylyl-sulfate kinase n=1 Tax=Kordia antarctica TaxID=1218801 RepID=A0A7L4ZGB5_9FLAO|nr:adenylyl-sulfate kinase [Kordia antarctica]QHI35461.1 putative adenylyl-sulfate kinase [Kordia antarctica]
MNNLTPFSFGVKKAERNELNGHASFAIWFTGLSGSGKSTLSNALERSLFDKGMRTYLLDGDNIRAGINKDLKFTANDREENLRRIAEITKLFVDSGTIVLSAFITPYKKSRSLIKKIVTPQNYIEVYVSTSLEECERRDCKGLYKKARKGEIKNFTGISDPYEAPENPDIIIDTEKETIEESIKRILNFVQNKLEAKINE